jgi:hypothetical protein
VAIDPEVFNTTVADHSPHLTMLFLAKSPLLRKVLEAGNIDKSQLESAVRRFTVMTGGPGTSTTYGTGREQRAVGLRPTSEVGLAYASLESYDYIIPTKVLDEANGKMDAAKLIKKFPEASLGDIQKGHALQFATGQSVDLSPGDRHYHPGMMTLMGSRTYNANGVAYNGLLEPCARAAQDGLVLGLRSEGGTGGVEGWYNQFAETSGYSGDGVQKLRDLCLDCNEALDGLDSQIAIALADKQSYSNHLTAVEGKLELSTLSSDSNILGPVRPMEGIKIANTGTIMFRDPYRLQRRHLRPEPRHLLPVRAFQRVRPGSQEGLAVQVREAFPGAGHHGLDLHDQEPLRHVHRGPFRERHLHWYRAVGPEGPFGGQLFPTPSFLQEIPHGTHQRRGRHPGLGQHRDCLHWRAGPSSAGRDRPNPRN